MVSFAFLLLLLIGLSGTLVAWIVVRPEVTATRGGKILAFVILFLLPLFCVTAGLSEHLEKSKRTQFCLSCHTMEPYGKSLLVDDPGYLAAAHFQNHRVDPFHACFTCHTDYTMFGDMHAKLHGLRHVYIYYLSKPKMPLHLYTSYNNRECLHCHLGARSFEEGAVHNADRETMAAIKANRVSCLSSGCHETVHNVAHLGNVKFWRATE